MKIIFDMSMHIDNVLIRYILNSRGLPTIETELVVCTSTNKSFTTCASTALGVSCGSHEKSIASNQDIMTNLECIKESVHWANKHITSELKGLELRYISTLDQFLLQMPAFTGDFWHNAIMTSISIAGYKAYGLIHGYDAFAIHIQDDLQNTLIHNHLDSADNPKSLNYSESSQTLSLRKTECNIKYKLPRPFFNLINGGLHAVKGGFVQEFLVIPLSSKTFEQSLNMGLVINEALYKILCTQDLVLGIGDEGGWIVDQSDPESILALLMQAIDRSNYQAGKDVILGLDVAASVFYDRDRYYIDNKSLCAEDMIIFYERLLDYYPIGILEDPLACNDISAWQALYRSLGQKVLLMGDDLFATQVEQLHNPQVHSMSNAALAKPNQAKTVLQLLAFCDLGHQYDWPIIISHRSGETEDSYLADLAVDLRCQGIKAGGLMRSERLAKYNQLLRIEEQINFCNQHAGMHDIKYKKL